MWVPKYDWLTEVLCRDPVLSHVGHADAGSLRNASASHSYFGTHIGLTSRIALRFATTMHAI